MVTKTKGSAWHEKEGHWNIDVKQLNHTHIITAYFLE
jgi:hypothetical protein